MTEQVYKGYCSLLKNWIVFSQRHLYVYPEYPYMICYGEGEHGHWGTHTHQKAFSAFAVAATLEDIDWTGTGLNRETVLNQALGMLRYNLNTHKSAEPPCTDGKHWGHNWIYSLGLERMFHGIEAIWDYMTPQDFADLKRVILSECDFILNSHPVVACLSDLNNENRPESNIWNGAILYRAAELYPNHPDKEKFIEKARQFFVNSLSMERDENSDEIIDGFRVGDLFVGANLFDTCACNHHIYLNVGYLGICLSNIAMLHFFMKGRNKKPDDIIYHNVHDVWTYLNTCTYSDGRLLRIGGDSRARYCYCQDYMLPAWCLIEDFYGEDCSNLTEGWLNLLKTETSINNDGSFLSNRFGRYEERSPVYYTRLESDRANTISMLIYWYKNFKFSGEKPLPELTEWSDQFHGSALTATGNRYASFTWRSSEKPQGLLLPKDDSSFAEWRYNLSARVESVGKFNDDVIEGFEMKPFTGGFVTSGSAKSCSENFMAEGQFKEYLARKHLAFAALPDDSSVLCLQYIKAINRAFVTLKGIFWNIPNDIFNGRTRNLYSETVDLSLRGGDYTESFEVCNLGSFVNVNNRIGLASTSPLTLIRNGHRQVDVKWREDSGTLYTEEICSPYLGKRTWFNRGDELVDVGFAMTLGDKEDTKKLSESLFTPQLPGFHSIGARGKDGYMYILVANFKDEAQNFDPSVLGFKNLYDLASDAPAKAVCLEPNQSLLLRVDD